MKSACGKGPSPQLAWGPILTGQQLLSRGGSAQLGERGQGSGWGGQGPLSGWEAPASPGAPLLPPHLTLLVVRFCCSLDRKLPSPTAALG